MLGILVEKGCEAGGVDLNHVLIVLFLFLSAYIYIMSYTP